MILRAVGLVLLVLGALFTFQGLGYVKGSPMTGESFWAIAGPVIAAIGLVLVLVSARSGSGRR